MEMTLDEALATMPAATDARLWELVRKYEMRATIAAAVGCVLAELVRDGLISFTEPE